MSKLSATRSALGVWRKLRTFIRTVGTRSGVARLYAF